MNSTQQNPKIKLHYQKRLFTLITALTYDKILSGATKMVGNNRGVGLYIMAMRKLFYPWKSFRKTLNSLPTDTAHILLPPNSSSGSLIKRLNSISHRWAALIFLIVLNPSFAYVFFRTSQPLLLPSLLCILFQFHQD